MTPEQKQLIKELLWLEIKIDRKNGHRCNTLLKRQTKILKELGFTDEEIKYM